jgi:hypothetical protein
MIGDLHTGAACKNEIVDSSPKYASIDTPPPKTPQKKKLPAEKKQFKIGLIKDKSAI